MDYVKKDLLLFSIIILVTAGCLTTLYLYDRSSNYFEETAKAIYSTIAK